MLCKHQPTALSFVIVMFNLSVKVEGKLTSHTREDGSYTPKGS